MSILVAAVGAVTLGTLGLGAWGVRFARTTSDLLVASRAVTAWWNAAAISGEYLSAASFLGIAGLEMQAGTSALWQSLGFTAGYLALLLFVAAPLRRFGSYTIPIRSTPSLTCSPCTFPRGWGCAWPTRTSNRRPRFRRTTMIRP
jgi:Na+(H+)/acetate symporter ActP